MAKRKKKSSSKAKRVAPRRPRAQSAPQLKPAGAHRRRTPAYYFRQAKNLLEEKEARLIMAKNRAKKKSIKKKYQKRITATRAQIRKIS